MTLAEKKKEILFETKQINALKMIRNKYPRGDRRIKKMQSIIDLAENTLAAKRAKYKI